MYIGVTEQRPGKRLSDLLSESVCHRRLQATIDMRNSDFDSDVLDIEASYRNYTLFSCVATMELNQLHLADSKPIILREGVVREQKV